MIAQVIKGCQSITINVPTEDRDLARRVAFRFGFHRREENFQELMDNVRIHPECYEMTQREVEILNNLE